MRCRYRAHPVKRRRHAPFRCPTCNEPMFRVIETREWQGGIRRKRVCPAGHVLITREMAAAA